MNRPDEPSGWQTIENVPKSMRVMVRGGERNVTDGYHDVQAAWVDSLGNVWLDDRKEGAAPAHPTHWMPLPNSPEKIDELRYDVTIRDDEGVHTLKDWGAQKPKESSSPFSAQTEAALSAILDCIDRFGDELAVRRIWDEARRASLAVNREAGNVRKE